MTLIPASVARRGFLQRASALAVGLAAWPRTARADVNDAFGTQDNPDRWLTALRAPHRQLFDMPAFNGGLPAVHVLNYLETYNKAYGVKDSDINAVGTFYGSTTLLAANDAMWAKYGLGELTDQKNAAGQAATANPWRTSVHALGMELPPAGIEPLQQRGVLFIACNNALNFWFGQIANARKLDVAAVDRDIRANLLPGVVVVPAMVIAIEKAQKAGFAYNKQ
jgi:intracellular sulfur oxidation DsrE/DsrF family protein